MENNLKIEGKHIKKKNLVFIIVIIAVIFALTVMYFNGKEKSGYIGEVEGVMYSHTSEVSGKILSCPVQLGSPVKKGDTIAVMDNTMQTYTVEQLEINLRKSKLAIGNTTLGQGGTADNKYSAAKAVYKSAESAVNKASEDYQNAQNLFAGAAIPKEKLDSAKLTYDNAVSAMEEAKASLRNVTDKTASSAANLDIALLESQLAQQQEMLEKYTIVASCDGIVMSLNYKQGDMVQPGYNIADLSATAEKYAVFYYPKENLDKLAYEQEVKVCLAENSKQVGKSIKGVIKFIDVKAQFTPKDLQTTANKNMESVKIKVLLPSDCKINPGQQVRISM